MANNNSKINDNRMRWIRNIQELKDAQCKEYNVEHEFASECRISGVLNYENGMMLCGSLVSEKDENGLYYYILKIKYPEITNYNEKADSKGYFFEHGESGELLALFSIFLGAASI